MADSADGIGKDGGYISKDYKLKNICHENIIVPNDRLWPNELDITKIVQR